jgi:hypothetical protein
MASFWGTKSVSAPRVGIGRWHGADFALAFSLPRFSQAEHQNQNSA